jgi:hypothetical protein
MSDATENIIIKAVQGFIGMLTIIITVIVMLPIGLWNAFVMQSLWNWFAVPYFNLHVLTYWYAFGFMVFINFVFNIALKAQKPDAKPLTAKQSGLALLGWACGSGGALLSGYIIKCLVG